LREKFIDVANNMPCPVCIIPISMGIGLCQFLGIGNLICGIWIGGLFLMLGLWLTEFLRKRKLIFPFQRVIIPILSLLFISWLLK